MSMTDPARPAATHLHCSVAGSQLRTKQQLHTVFSLLVHTSCVVNCMPARVWLVLVEEGALACESVIPRAKPQLSAAWLGAAAAARARPQLQADDTHPSSTCD